tara:strand:+ start:83 stop:256 length:174 start_codon:yes stop_codon:yes gene_type:complete
MRAARKLEKRDNVIAAIRPMARNQGKGFNYAIFSTWSGSEHIGIELSKRKIKNRISK